MEELENGTEHRVTEAQIRKRIDLKPTDHPETIRSLKLPGKTVYRGTNPITSARQPTVASVFFNSLSRLISLGSRSDLNKLRSFPKR